jgi:hypothetical protein
VSEFSFAELQTACEREVKYRERVYRRLVDNEKMSQDKADREIALMRAAAEHFKNIAEQVAGAGRLI